MLAPAVAVAERPRIAASDGGAPRCWTEIEWRVSFCSGAKGSWEEGGGRRRGSKGRRIPFNGFFMFHIYILFSFSLYSNATPLIKQCTFYINKLYIYLFRAMAYKVLNHERRDQTEWKMKFVSFITCCLAFVSKNTLYPATIARRPFSHRSNILQYWIDARPDGRHLIVSIAKSKFSSRQQRYLLPFRFKRFLNTYIFFSVFIFKSFVRPTRKIHRSKKSKKQKKSAKKGNETTSTSGNTSSFIANSISAFYQLFAKHPSPANQDTRRNAPAAPPRCSFADWIN